MNSILGVRTPALSAAEALVRNFLLIAAAASLAGCVTASASPGTSDSGGPAVVISAAESATPFSPIDTPSPTVTSTPPPKATRVLIVSFDGLRPDEIAKANMVNVLALIQGGAYTLSAQTINPSLSLPASASMLVGTCPDKHIVRWDQYVPQNGYALGTDIFDLAHAAGLRTVMITAFEKFRQLTVPSSTDYFAFVDDSDKITDQYSIDQLALQQIPQGFGLMFVQFARGEDAGHEFGWLSRPQLEAFANEDQSLGYVIDALKTHGMYDGTLIIITSDHGGKDNQHADPVPEDLTIPWLISGPGIRPMQLTTRVNIMDTAATAAFALGLPIPPEWDGRPVLEAYGAPGVASAGC